MPQINETSWFNLSLLSLFIIINFLICMNYFYSSSKFKKINSSYIFFSFMY